ncbi:MAG: hypothetical protein LBH54_05205, partial [Clostridiales bacterium]|nr:hypothetical protein [Clostridiales bacterium]
SEFVDSVTWGTKTFPLVFGQIYYVGTDGDFVVDSGPLDPSTGRRKNIYTGNVTTNIAWQQGGVLVYDTASGKTPVARSGSIEDLKSVYKDGEQNAAKVFWLLAHGSGRQYIVYLP